MAATPQTFDPTNVQGDVLPGLPKRVQHYLLFQIDDDVAAFRKRLNLLIPLITTTAEVQDHRAKIAAYKKAATALGIILPPLPMWGVNIAFSHSGLVKLGMNDDIGDTAFTKGQLADSKSLGDPGASGKDDTFTPDWITQFKNPIHGVIIISGDSHLSVDAAHTTVSSIFNIGFQPTLHEALTLKGSIRPGDQKGHEHFGFLDGISQPAVKDFDTKPDPGQETVRQGVILCGRENDADARTGKPFVRPAWALDGSFLTLRYLAQLVPEFNNFLKASEDPLHGLTADLIGARLMGRWKSGAPTDLFPLQDNPAAGMDPAQRSNFTYDPSSQDRCPFAAHTRKANPRADLESKGFSTENRRIIRRGIQFGPEVTAEEAASGKTQHDRGLIFVAYSGSITNGFQFIQKSWANNTKFPIDKPVDPGFDPVIGQNGADSVRLRSMTGVHPDNTGESFPLPADWVVPKGGEYFFSPSISALRSTFALA
ncbi:hypothetical protein GSI_07563 [Ganoderma sinense ZZ0214-1]|uniref:Dyp-type peroxidase n=1 Tax=Ganoderma sinense ZZ0214-1 TaxID=1077348 RepID=A0A2G8S9W7_9APHY|nr:hypothetical protein GSI_07563 [Ganoderma sinense ZZ0214-1]